MQAEGKKKARGYAEKQAVSQKNRWFRGKIGGYAEKQMVPQKNRWFRRKIGGSVDERETLCEQKATSQWGFKYSKLMHVRKTTTATKKRTRGPEGNKTVENTYSVYLFQIPGNMGYGYVHPFNMSKQENPDVFGEAIFLTSP